MAKNRIIKQRILATQEELMDEDEVAILKHKSARQVLLLLSGYIPLVLFAIYVFLFKESSLRKRDILGNEIHYDEEDIDRVHRVLPFVVGFALIMATIYFGKYFYEVVWPIMKDIRNRKKSVYSFQVEKTDMSAFNRYYITSPVFKKQQLQIKAEDFHMLKEGDLLSLEMAPLSFIIFHLVYKGKEIEYLNH